MKAFDTLGLQGCVAGGVGGGGGNQEGKIWERDRI